MHKLIQMLKRGIIPFLQLVIAKYVKEEIKECRAHFQNAGEGFPYVLMIKTKNADLKPGDLIVKGGQKKL